MKKEKEKNESKAVMSVASDEALAALKNEYPTEATFNRVLLPRLGMVSQDVTKGKGKNMKVVEEAGTFFIERETDEVDEDTGKKIWEKTEIGTSLEAIILFQRKQLRYYDQANEKYESTPVYDNDDDVLPLFCDKQEVDRGTPAELKSREKYKGTTVKGKPKSKLEDNRILYVLYTPEGADEAEVFQLNLRGTSMYAYMQYCRDLGKKGLAPNTQLTAFNSEAKESGATEWNQMTFEAVRTITKAEASDVLEKVTEIKEGIATERSFYASREGGDVQRAEGESDEDFEDRKKRLKNF